MGDKSSLCVFSLNPSIVTGVAKQGGGAGRLTVGFLAGQNQGRQPPGFTWGGGQTWV